MAITSFFRFWNTYKNMKRIRQIVNVFLRHGFGQIVEQIDLQCFIPIRKRFRLFESWDEIKKLQDKVPTFPRARSAVTYINLTIRANVEL